MTPHALQEHAEARDAAALEALISAEEAEGLDAAERWALAQSIAESPARKRELKTDGTIVYADLRMTIDGRSVDLDEACDIVIQRLTTGRHDEAEAIGRAMIAVLTRQIDSLLQQRRAG
ncbi:MAG: hypothetical protein J0H00_06495 [Burkholderiales bacterium]|nr:hypothetical protein [Burkholderiales bacterium]